jgi:hypothetical protein
MLTTDDDIDCADTTPGNIIANMIIPTSRLIVRDLAKKLNDLIGNNFCTTQYKFTNLCRFDDVTRWLWQYLSLRLFLTIKKVYAVKDLSYPLPFIIISPHAKNLVHAYNVLYEIYLTIPQLLNYWGSGLWWMGPSG